MPRPNSRRQRALDQLDIARDAISKAMVLLGGRTRVRFVKKNQRTFITRQYLESIAARLGVTRDLLAIEVMLTTSPDDILRALEKDSSALRDDFERTYDQERDPGC